MKKILLLILAFICFKQTLQAQTDTLICDYPDRDTTQFEQLPWFGNNAYLETFAPVGLRFNLLSHLRHRLVFFTNDE
ncbi:MAG: hypothetical protein ABIP30_13405 [Ferruginibacter sp.]